MLLLSNLVEHFAITQHTLRYSLSLVAQQALMLWGENGDSRKRQKYIYVVAV
jgi:hypothetical protein